MMMETVLVTELDGVALDWTVARLLGREERFSHDPNSPNYFSPSTKYEHGGPLIDDMGISMIYDAGLKYPYEQTYRATTQPVENDAGWMYGPTSLKAGMRCLVSYFSSSDTVDVPSNIMNLRG